MTGSEPQPDYCPRCGSALEIVSVKFRFGRTAIVAACPNCELEFAEQGRVARSKAITEFGKKCRDGSWPAASDRSRDAPSC